jgi:hypothetical protein
MPKRERPRLGAKSWIVVYIVAALVFALIMLWFATARRKRGPVNVHNGASDLDIVEGYSDETLLLRPELRAA